MQPGACTRAPRDRWLWSSSVAMTAGFIVVAMVFCVYGYQIIHPGDGWFVPADIRQLSPPGTKLLHGHLGTVYRADRELYALPLAFPLLGVAAEIASWAHLPNAPHQTWFLLYGPYVLAFGVLVLHAVRLLAWETGIRRRLWLVQAAAVVLVLVPEIEWGHLEDVLALVAVLHALRALLRADLIRAALLVSVAVSFKQWAVMLIPLVVLAAPAGRRLRTLAAAGALPAILVLTFLLFDFKHAFHAFFVPVVQVEGYPGHPWLDATWLGAFSSQANRAAAVVAAGAVAWRWRNRALEPVGILTAAGIILIIRPLTETINYSYYWSPGLLLLVLALVAATRDVSVAHLAWPVAAMVWTLPRSNPVTAQMWWAGELLLLAVSAGLVARSGRSPSTQAVPPEPEAGAVTMNFDSELSGAYR